MAVAMYIGALDMSNSKGCILPDNTTGSQARSYPCCAHRYNTMLPSTVQKGLSELFLCTLSDANDQALLARVFKTRF